MYLTASLDQPLHYAGEGLNNKLGHGHGHGPWAMGDGGWRMAIGEKDRLVHAYHSLFMLLTAALLRMIYVLLYCRRGSSENICTLLTYPRCIAPFHA